MAVAARSSPPVVFLMGPPGSGKGTQVAALEREFGFEGIDTGALLRALSKEDSSVGRRVKALMDTGRFAPSPLVAELVTGRVRRFLREGKAVALEGSPRTLHEAEVLLSGLRADGMNRVLVVFLDVPKAQTVQRIMERWVCEGCQRSTMLSADAPEGCADCGGKLVRRADDTPEVAEKRWEEYTFRTLPVIRFFERQGLVVRVESHRSISEVTHRVHTAVRQRLGL
ncbi:MAG: adenylate kinase [Parcubacteria group bacterium Gr01-1014_38]|nr:MAG: adenylate kinase [Parcubacteria group bacterium Gr01-1014_38]